MVKLNLKQWKQITYKSLKSADIDGTRNNEKLNNTIQPWVNVFPNPVKNSNMHIQLKGYEAMDNLDIYTNHGSKQIVKVLVV